MEGAEREVAALLEKVQGASSNAEQMDLFRHVQEIVTHRDPSGPERRVLRSVFPLLGQLAQLQNTTLVASILQLVAQEAAAASATANTASSEAVGAASAILAGLYEVCHTVLLLSYSTEKNVVLALQLALSNLHSSFQIVLRAESIDSRVDMEAKSCWGATVRCVEATADVVANPPETGDNNRSVMVWLRAWKLLESGVMLFSTAQDASVYRDPMRSNVQPNACSLDRLSGGNQTILVKTQLEEFGVFLLQRLCGVVGAAAESKVTLARREMSVAINSVSLLAAARPQHMPHILPGLISLSNAVATPGREDAVMQKTLTANLVKLLSHPAAQPFADEVTDILIAVGASQRAFAAISKSKEQRRRYTNAPTEASLRRARIGKRTAAQSITERVENANAHAKRRRVNLSESSAAPMSREKVTHDGIVNMQAVEVANLVLESFASDMPTPAPSNLQLELVPSALKTRMSALLAKLATPSSALAIEKSAKRMRDPRLRRDPKLQTQNKEQPALVPIFDDSAVEEVSDWISKNAATIAEPLVSVSEDNVVQVHLKAETAAWQHEMAIDALVRILENEYGVKIRGDEALREGIVCRLASSPWLLSTDEKNKPVSQSDVSPKLPFVYQKILDFVLGDYSVRSTLATNVLCQEYIRATASQLSRATDEGIVPPGGAADYQIYRISANYFFGALQKKMNLSSSADKKLFGSLVAQLPRIPVEILRLVTSLFSEKSGIVLGITLLRDLCKERKACQMPCLLLLLRFTCHEDEHYRNSAIRCVANQLYGIGALKSDIEGFAIKLVNSLREPVQVNDLNATEKDEEMSEAVDGAENGESTHIRDASEAVELENNWLKNQVQRITLAEVDSNHELQAYAEEVQGEAELSKPSDNETEILRRLELYLALCAKKPSLLTHMVASYAYASETVRQVVFRAIEKLIKHLKQRGSVNVVAQLHGYEPNALGLVCHIIQILSLRGRPNEPSTSATDELVQQILELYRSHEHIPDSISVLIPVLPSIRGDVLFPLLPHLLSLPPARLSVAMTRLLEAMPPQVVAPIDLLVALHHVDLKSEPSMQKKVINAINICVEHRHAFPSDVLLHVCRVLVQEERISKLSLRTLILSVTAYPTLQKDMASLLNILIERRVWEMEDALWKGFVKCSALIQPASFPLLLHKLPVPQLDLLLTEEKELRVLLREFAFTAGPDGQPLDLPSEINALLEDPQEVKLEGVPDIEEPEMKVEKTDPVDVDDGAQPSN
ncbi:Symplekin tight junction protein C terminal [Phytophthora infestans]|uniref:Symplekin tight junction protein C terminal n=1 Tax=Phytophthora infestans TaxID=4787 RepID=A0A8S9UCM3_PHYIN|nr:Symplekin tight junction protein C terminal [Phytophthora infestans]